MTIRIEPLDTFFFRDGKPFTMGAETWTDTVFPPSPSVFYGALRTCWLSNQIGVFSKENIDLSEKLQIKGLFIQINDNLYLPVPNDFVEKKRNRKERLLTDKVESVISNKQVSLLTTQDKTTVVEDISDNALMSVDNFENYLKKFNLKNLQYRNSSYYITKDSKIGISRNSDARTTEEGMLYRVDFNRFKSDEKTLIAFVVDFEGLDSFPEEGIIKLGGEGKLASFKSITSEKVTPPSFQDADEFKLYIATPTIFDNTDKGWLPEWIDEQSLLSKGFKFKVKLHSVSIGKPVMIGGFDLLIGKPKPMYKAIPAGSVYHFKLLEGQMSDVINEFHGKTISEIYSKQGFGLSYIGKI